MNYQQLRAYLERNWPKHSARRPTTHYPFEQLRALLDRLGNPQQELEVVGVTGTKGKGSMARLTAGVLEAHGVRAGLFTSPHLVRIEERLLVDGQPLPPDEFAGRFGAVLTVRDEAGLAELGVTPLLLAQALTWFRARGAGVAVLEVRSGGRFDPTAVAAPPTVCLGPIGLEHVPGLGYNLADIAWQKTGLVQPGGRCFLAQQPPEAARVIARECRNLGAEACWLGRELDFRILERDEQGQRIALRTPGAELVDLTLGMLGEHQAANAALAVAAAETVLGRLGRRLQRGPLQTALRAARWPARLERLADRPLLLYDGAHTPESAEALAQALADHFPARRWTFILGLLQGKSGQGVLRALAPLAERVLIVPVPGFSFQPPELLVGIAQRLGLPAEARPNLEQALAEAHDQGAPTCVSGSLYLYADCLRALPRWAEPPAPRGR